MLAPEMGPEVAEPEFTPRALSPELMHYLSQCLRDWRGNVGSSVPVSSPWQEVAGVETLSDGSMSRRTIMGQQAFLLPTLGLPTEGADSCPPAAPIAL